jgi:hypothetical protein
MSKKFHLAILFFSVLQLTLLFFPFSSYAVFNLTASPTEGGFDLRFNRLSPGDFKQVKEVELRVNSDIAKQYRILQRVVAPLSTSDGTTIPSEQFRMYPKVNSNTAGTLLYREEAPLGQFDTVLYTSNSIGQNDSIRLVYTLTPEENQTPGSYYGRIAYILTPIDSTQSQTVVTLNIYVDLGAGNKANIEVGTASGSSRLYFTSKGMTQDNVVGLEQPVEIFVKVHYPLGSTYRIYQDLSDASLMSVSGQELDLTKILFSAKGGERGTVTKEGDLKSVASRQLLYISDPIGAPDEFKVTYKSSDDFRLQTTGFYRGRLNFVIEKEQSSNPAPQVVKTFDVEIDIVPLFDINVYSQGQKGVSLRFGDASYKTGPKTSDVDIFVETNMGKPYQVIQKVLSPMVNEGGDKIPQKDFVVRVKDIGEAIEPKFYLKDTAPVKEGETAIFTSSAAGESAHFKVEYQLTLRPDSKGGNYSTHLGYSLALN